MIKDIFASGLLCFGVAVTPAQEGQEKRQVRRTVTTQQHEVSEHERNSRWIHNVNGHEKSVHLRGDVEFNDDYTDVKNIPSGGFFQLREAHTGFVRQLEVTRGANGELERRYTVGGAQQPYDAEARTWFAKTIADALRSGFDARARSQKLLRERGAAGVLDEVAKLTSDHAKRIFYTTVLDSDNLDSSSTRRVLEEAGRQIKNSDHERAKLLEAVARRSLSDREVRVLFFELAGMIKSDHERRRVLSAVLNQHRSDSDVLLAALKSASAMSSDHEKAKVLSFVARGGAMSDEVRAALLEAINTIKSDYERKRVLAAL